MADPVAPERQVVVRRVLPRLEPAAGAFGAHVCPPRAEERSHQAPPSGRHARQPRRTAPPQEVEENRLGLVVGRVRHEHRRCAVRHPCGLEDVVSRRARPRFEVGSPGDGHAARIEPRAQPRREVGHDARLALAPRSQAVVDVHRDRRESVVDRDGQEHKRVGATRASDDDWRDDVVRHLELHRRRHRALLRVRRSSRPAQRGRRGAHPGGATRGARWCP